MMTLSRMGVRLLAVWLGVALFSAVAGEPSARSLKQCPFGHKTLVNVPIMYGLVVATGPKEEEEMAKDIANHKYSLGGCTVMLDSPKQEVACTTCGFTYSVFSTKKAKDGSWTLVVEDRKKLFRPLSAFWDDFPPLADGKDAGQRFMQSFDRRMKLRWESVSFERKGSPASVAKLLQPWLERREMILSETKESNQRMWNWRRENPVAELSITKEKPGWVSVGANRYGP